MKNWKIYNFTVNGFSQKCKFNKETVDNIFIPLLKKFTEIKQNIQNRMIIFLAAPPATGKSTLLSFLEYLSLQDESICNIQGLGLDGFHYHSDYINRHNILVNGVSTPMREVKGCPETFDTQKFKEKLLQIKDSSVLWPVYDRTIHDVVEDKIIVDQDILIIEGNWLLLNEEPWKSFIELADYTILITADEELLKKRLIDRKIKGGFSATDALEWYLKSDSVNVKRTLDNSLPGMLNLQLSEDGDFCII